MGKIVFKVLGNVDKDYIPTDAIADVAVSGGAASATFAIESTGTEIIPGETLFTKNFAAGIRTSGVSVSAPTLAGGVTASVRLLIFEGNTPGEGTLVEVQIIDGGSGYESSASPKVTVTDKSGTPHELDVTLGKGSPETTEFDEFVFARDGEFVNSTDGILLSQVSNLTSGGKKDDNFDDSVSNLITSRASSAKQISPMNILNNTVKLSDMGGFAKKALTFYSVRTGLKQLAKAEQQIIEYNETQGQQLIAQAEANYQTALKNHEIAVGKINHEEAAKLAGPMSSFQQRWRVDMSQFSNMQANPMNADPIWTILGNMVSRFGWVQGAKYSYSQPRLASLLRRRRIPGTGGFPDYPPNVEYPPTPTFQQPATGGGMSAPGWFKPAKAAGKFLLWKTLCFAAIATLVHIFERLTSSGNFSTFESSGGRIPYCARAWAPDIRDGKYVSWLKSEMRSHDILMFLLQLRTYMGAKVKQTSKSVAKISKSTLTSLGIGQPDIESSKLEILFKQAQIGASLHSILELDDMLKAYIQFAESRKVFTQNGEIDYTKWAVNVGVTETRSRSGTPLPVLPNVLGTIEFARGLLRVALDKGALGLTQITQQGSLLPTNVPFIVYSAFGNSYGVVKDPGSFRGKQGLTYFGDFSTLPSPLNSSLTSNQNPKGAPNATQNYEIYGSNHALNPDSTTVGDLKLTLDEAGGPISLSKTDSSDKYTISSPFVVRFETPVMVSPTNDVFAKSFEIETDSPTLKQVQHTVNSAQAAVINNAGGKDNKIKLAASAELGRISAVLDDTSTAIDGILEIIETHLQKNIAVKGRKSFTVKNQMEGMIIKSTKAIKGGKGAGVSEAEIDVAERMQKLALYSPELGMCTNKELTNWDKEHFNTFFIDKDSYDATRRKGRQKESICDKTSCGVVQVYSNVPSVGEETSIAADKLSVEGDPICGNVTVQYNLHPTTAAEFILRHDAIGGNLTDGNTIVKELRIKGGSAGNLDKLTLGSVGDVSLPPVFGNWTEVQGLAEKGGGLGSLIKAPFKLVFGIIQLYEDLDNYAITEPNALAALGRTYLESRFHFSDAKVQNASKISAPNRFDAVEAGKHWKGKSSQDYRDVHHLNSLQDIAEQITNIKSNNPYSPITEASSHHDWVQDYSTLKEQNYLTPILSTEQTFSGLCYPVITESGINEKGFKIALATADLGNYGPTVNDYQLEEEIFVGRGEGNSITNGMSNNGRNFVNSNHLPIGAIEKADNTFTEAGHLANKTVFVPNTAYFKDIYKQAADELKHISSWCPRFNVENITLSLISQRENGRRLPAGGGDFAYPEGTDLTNVSTEEIQSHCMDIEQYSIDAAVSHAQGYWNDNNTVQNARPWDSYELKAKHDIPHYVDNTRVQLGNSYISGKEADDAESARSKLIANINLYHSWVNKLHFTGAHMLKEGARIFSEDIRRALGYSNNVSTTDGPIEAQNEAWTNLRTDFGATDWDAALLATDGQGNSLAVSGHSGSSPESINVQWQNLNGTEQWTITDIDGNTVITSPLTPSVLGSNITSVSKVYNSDAYSESSAKAQWRQEVLVDGCGPNMPDAVLDGSLSVVSFNTEQTGIGDDNLSAALAAETAIGDYSTTQYNTYAHIGMNDGPTAAQGFFKRGTVAYEPFGPETTNTLKFIGKDLTQNSALSERASNDLGYTGSWRSLYASGLANVDSATSGTVTEIATNGGAGSWDMSFSESASTVSQALDDLKTRLYNFNNDQISYYSEVMHVPQSELEYVNGNIIDATHSMFQTGTITTTVDPAFSGLFLWDHDHCYTTSPNMGLRASNQLWLAATQLGVVDNTSIVCKSDMSDNNCGGITSSERPIDIERDCNYIYGAGYGYPESNCEIEIMDDLTDGVASATNWTSVMNQYRENMYSVLRDRLASGQYDTEIWNPIDNSDGCNDPSVTSDYSISDISAGKFRVFPHSGLLQSGTTSDYLPNACDLGANYAPAFVTSKADLNNITTGLFSGGGYGGQGYTHTINLKEWASTGDIDIYIREELNLYMRSGASGDCPNGEGNETIGVGKLQRSITWYKYSTAIYKPWDSSDLISPPNTGAASHTAQTTIIGATRLVSGDMNTSERPYVKATTPLQAPWVINGNKDCKTYNTNIWRAALTGAIDTKKTIAIAPLGRDEFKATVTVSGSIQTVTGKCDWSSNKRPVYINETGADGEAISRISGYQEVKENYIIQYSEGYSGLHAYQTKAGQSSQANGGPQATPYSNPASLPNETVNPESRSEAAKVLNENTIEIDGTYINPVKSFIASPEGSEGDDATDPQKYLIGGWRRVNQTADATTLNQAKHSSFKRTYYIQTDAAKAYAKTMKTFLDTKVWGANVIAGEKRLLGKDIEEAQNRANLKDNGFGSVEVRREGNDIVMTTVIAGQPDFVVRYNIANESKATKSKIEKAFEARPVYLFPVWMFEYDTAACTTCVAETNSEVGVSEPVVFMNESYKHIMQVDWQLRSGNWEFEVPFLEPGKPVSQTLSAVDTASDNPKASELLTKPWYEYVDLQFFNSANKAYTGHYSAYGLTFENMDTSQQCKMKEGQSKLDKIYDYQIELNDQEANYNTLKSQQRHQINFQGK